jgi:hypothetical protein
MQFVDLIYLPPPGHLPPRTFTPPDVTPPTPGHLPPPPPGV